MKCSAIVKYIIKIMLRNNRNNRTQSNICRPNTDIKLADCCECLSLFLDNQLAFKNHTESPTHYGNHRAQFRNELDSH